MTSSFTLCPGFSSVDCILISYRMPRDMLLCVWSQQFMRLVGVGGGGGGGGVGGVGGYSGDNNNTNHNN